MPTPKRVELIKQIEEARNSRLLVYITGDRRGFETRIASDVFPFLLEHLMKFNHADKIDLFIYTPGGQINAASGLVALIREFASRFGVLIPFKAHSAGTLIALGADSIVMSRVGQMTPVDPSVNSPYNPTSPSVQPGVSPRILPVNVEDVIAYLDLAKKEADLRGEAALVTVFQDLASKVHPLALGNVYRAREQIGYVARRLLRTHLKGEDEVERIERIVSTLTRELYSHGYIIGRNEAIELLRLPMIEDFNPEWDEPIWDLYKEYESLLELTNPYAPEILVGEGTSIQQTFIRAIIESSEFTHAFVTTREITRVQITQPNIPAPVSAFPERNIQEGWIANAEV